MSYCSPFPRRYLAPVLIFATAACSQSDESIELRPDGRDPPSVARALSIGGRLAESDSGTDRAVNCTAALKSTVERVGALGGSGDQNGIAAARRATELYRKQAIAASGGDAAAADRAIARRVAERREDAGGEAQASIACLRALQDAAA